MTKRLFIGVDLQEGFLSDRIRASQYIQNVSNYLASLDKSQVVLTRFINQPNSNFVTLMDWPKMQADDADVRLLGNLESQNFDVVEKSTYSSWTPDVIAKARNLQCEEIVIFGLDSHACVLKTALDVFDDGFVPVVLSDLCESSDGTDQDTTGLKLIADLIGVRQVISSSELSED